MSSLRFVNPEDTPTFVQFGFEILDSEGNRLGIGGNDRDRVEGSEQADLVGWAAAFTVTDIDLATNCALLEVSAS